MYKFKLSKLYDADGDLGLQWFVFYYFENPDTGKFDRFREFISKRLKTKSARYERAIEVRKRINEKLQMGWNPFVDSDKGLTTLNEALEFGLKIKLAKCQRKRSRFSYYSAVKLFRDYLKDKKVLNKPVKEFNYLLAQEYQDHMLVSCDLANSTINNRVEFVKSVFNEVKKREYITHNPFARVEKLKKIEPPITSYTEEELTKIKKILPDYNYNLYVISQLIFYCFLRPQEIVRLQFEDIVWDHSMIVMPGPKTKNGKSQVIIMPESLKNNIKHWIRTFPSSYYIFSRNLKPGIIEIAPTRIAEAWRKFREANNLPDKKIYDLKHTGNGMAFDQGMNARDIQLQNRHHSLDQTQEYLNKFRRIPSEKFKKEFKGY